MTSLNHAGEFVVRPLFPFTKQTTDLAPRLPAGLESLWKAWERWDECLAARNAAEVESGMDSSPARAAEEASDIACGAYHDTALQIATTPATTIVGLKRKLELLNHLDELDLEPWYWSNGIYRKLLDSAIEDTDRLMGGAS